MGTAPEKDKHEGDEKVGHEAVAGNHLDGQTLPCRRAFCQSAVQQQQTCLDGPGCCEGENLENKGHLASEDGLRPSLGIEALGHLLGHIVAAILGDLVDADDDAGEVDLRTERVSIASWPQRVVGWARTRAKTMR